MDSSIRTLRTFPSKRALRSRSEEHTSELQSRLHLVCRLLLEKKKKKNYTLPRDKTWPEHMHHNHLCLHAAQRTLANTLELASYTSVPDLADHLAYPSLRRHR